MAMDLGYGNVITLCKIGYLSVNRTFYFCERQAFAMTSNMASSGQRKMVA